MVDGLPPGDREHPGPQVARLGARIGPKRGQERVLEAVLRVLGPDHAAQEGQHARGVLVEESLEGGQSVRHRRHSNNQTTRGGET